MSINIQQEMTFYTNKPKFIDLFAGIGGFRIGFEKAGYECVFSSEIDNDCREVYKNNFNETPFGDIALIDTKKIPHFDILLAGFPCQPFSICGKKRGFEDIRGNLFFDICRIAYEKKPKVIVLENVKHIIHHDKGKTLSTIIQKLEELQYTVSFELLNSKDFGLPQNRERIVIVASSRNIKFNFDLLEKKNPVKLEDFLDKHNHFDFLPDNEYTLLKDYTVQKTGLIFIGYRNKNIWKTGIRPNTEHLSRVHRQPNRIYSVKGTHPTLPSQETSGRFFIYLPEQNKVRKLTLSECYRIMGFAENFQKSKSISAQYKQIGNSVCIPMIEEIAKQIKKQGLIMPKFYDFCEEAKNINDNNLQQIKDKLSASNILIFCDEIINNMYSNKGVYTVLITLLFYKHLHPEQDVRLHQATLKNGNKKGFSGRSFDTNYITPILKQLNLPSMGESGWLTRSLEQNLPYDLNFPGRINKKNLKNAFLQILNHVEEKENISYKILCYIMNKSFFEKDKNFIAINKLKTSEVISINFIINSLEKHFDYKYQTSGAAKLPMIAFHAIYQILIKEISKFSNCYIPDIGSYTASDRTSKTAGDLEVFYSNKKLKEAVEIKLGIPINSHIVRRAKEKIFQFNPERYYILSTVGIDSNDTDCINKEISFIKQQHGCQLILNGVIPTLKYYLRLINNTNDFINIYSKLIECDNELKLVHKEFWNDIITKFNKIDNL